ncbi:MAG: hypothetical protein IJO60_02820 [Agathobacter sp.]|nr:hypothetical protein [Agathobacter sp.]
MSPAEQILEYVNTVDDKQEQIREKVLESYKDISLGKGRDYNEFFEDLEKRYMFSSV